MDVTTLSIYIAAAEKGTLWVVTGMVCSVRALGVGRLGRLGLFALLSLPNPSHAYIPHCTSLLFLPTHAITARFCMWICRLLLFLCVCSNLSETNRQVKPMQVIFKRYYEICARSNYNFDKPFLCSARQLSQSHSSAGHASSLKKDKSVDKLSIIKWTCIVHRRTSQLTSCQGYPGLLVGLDGFHSIHLGSIWWRHLLVWITD